MKDFAKIIAEQRKKKKMTQEELAGLLGITPQAVSKWENGVGLPDVTMFPLLAEVLDISIEKLFGMEKKAGKKPAVPVFEGMPLVAEYGDRACYSDKKLLSCTDGVVQFADGSHADLRTEIVTNCGAGEVRVICAEAFDEFDSWESGQETVYEESPGAFESLSLTLSCYCNVHVRSALDGKAKMVAKGTEKFVKLIKTNLKDQTFRIQIGSPNQNRSGRSNGNQVEIEVPFLEGGHIDVTVNGSSDVFVKPNFRSGNFSINGSGDITANSFQDLDIRIAGSGDVTVGEVSEYAKMHVMGSGDIVVAKAANPQIKIMGSGDISLQRAYGDMNVQITGSGDVTCAGEARELVLFVSGSGDFVGKDLTVENADIKVQGNADLVLGRIKGKSVEKLGKACSLKVVRRG